MNTASPTTAEVDVDSLDAVLRAASESTADPIVRVWLQRLREGESVAVSDLSLEREVAQ